MGSKEFKDCSKKNSRLVEKGQGREKKESSKAAVTLRCVICPNSPYTCAIGESGFSVLFLGAPGSVKRSVSLSAPMLVGKDGRPHVPDAVERRANALASLKLICESPVFFPHLELLLATQDSQGNTPFMASIANRAYPASLVLLEAAIRVAKDSSNDEETQRKTLMACVFPENSPPDNSPLYVVCCNDTCSFTWTGAEHINQVYNGHYIHRVVLIQAFFRTFHYEL